MKKFYININKEMKKKYIERPMSENEIVSNMVQIAEFGIEEYDQICQKINKILEITPYHNYNNLCKIIVIESEIVVGNIRKFLEGKKDMTPATINELTSRLMLYHVRVETELKKITTI